jgi:hypothetical protein
MNIRWSINKSNIINYILTVKVLQEANAKIEQLENRIKQLENK